jgi:hypothetical protein
MSSGTAQEDREENDTPPAEAWRAGPLLVQGGRFSVFEHVAGPEPDQRPRVIKRLLDPESSEPSYVQRLRNLSPKILALHHPSAEEVASIRAQPGDCALLCERLQGESLDQLLHRGARLSMEEARTVCMQICSALCAAHTVGLAHGDLTPERVVFVRPYGKRPLEIKVRGFGLGRYLGEGLFGSPSYLAPEQVDPFSPRPAPTPQSDQFALASLLIEMLTGRRAFAGDSVAEVRHKLMHHDPPQTEWIGASPEDVRRVHRVLERALAKAPDQRFRLLHEFVEALIPRAPASVCVPVSSSLAQPLPVRLVLGANLQLVVPEAPTIHLLPRDHELNATLPALRLEPAHAACFAADLAAFSTPDGPVDPNATLPLLRPVDAARLRQAALAPSPPGSHPGAHRDRNPTAGMGSLSQVWQRLRRPLGIAAVLIVIGFAVLGYAAARQGPQKLHPGLEGYQPDGMPGQRSQLSPEPDPASGSGEDQGVPGQAPREAAGLRRRPARCSIKGSTSAAARAIQLCLARSSLHIGPIPDFPLRTNSSGAIQRERLPAALKTQSFHRCVHQAIESSESLRALLRRGLHVSCP